MMPQVDLIEGNVALTEDDILIQEIREATIDRIGTNQSQKRY